MMFPMVTMSMRVFLKYVVTRPAIMSEMIWKERPAQSSRAASKVLKPMSLICIVVQ